MLPSVITRNIPIFDTLREYAPENLWDDGVAGLTVALLAVPQCIAYAYLTGFDPEYGLYAGLVGVIAAAILGSNEHMNTGPTASICVVVGGVMAGLNLGGNATALAVLTVMVGGLQIVFALLKLGNLSRFVSNAVVTGFIGGVSIVIIGDQVINLLGIDEVQSAFFIERLYQGLQVFPGPRVFYSYSVLLGTGTIVLMAGLRYVHERMPAGLLTIVVGAGITYAFSLHQVGIEIVGNIPSGFPSFTPPGTDWMLYADLFSGALALTILTSVQAVSISRSIASESHQKVDENQELIGQGAANIAAGLFKGFPISASFSRSFFNYAIGARTRLSSVFCGLFFGIIILFATPLAYYIPTAVLYGLIIVAVSDAINWEEIKISIQTTRSDQFAFLATFAGALFLKLDWAIYLGVAVSLIFYIRKATRLDLKEYILDREGELKQITEFSERLEPRVAIVDVNGEAFFGSAEQIKQRISNMIAESKDLKVIVLRMKNAMNLDVTGAQVLREIAEDLESRDRTLMLCGTTPKIREVLEESGVADIIGPDKILVAQKNLLASTRQAIERAQAHIDTVLEGEKDRDEEDNPPLQHTMEQLDSEEEPEETQEQDPVTEEKVQPQDENQNE